MKKQKQSIFDFNHIDPQIQEEELEEIKNLFRFYHKRFWCLKRAHGRFKKMNLLINLASSGLVAIGTIAGGVTMNPIVLGVISGLGLVVKTASEMRRSDLEKLFDIQNDEKRSPSNIGGTGEKMGSGDDEFSISPTGSLSIIP